MYALYGGQPPRTWVAYVGMAGDLNRRLIQHFVNRDSSVVTGASAAGLNIDLVRRVDWWEHPSFGDGDALHAAELIAFEVLDPALRSRGNPRKNALTKVDDQAFRAEIEALVRGAAAGRFLPPDLWDIYARVIALEEEVTELRSQLSH